MGTWRQTSLSALPIRAKPSHDAEILTCILFGEPLIPVRGPENGWMLVRGPHDDKYEGYIQASCASKRPPVPTHRVRAARAALFRDSALTTQSDVMHALPMNALVRVTETVGAASGIEDFGFVESKTLAPIGQFEDDFVSVCERWIGTSYRFGMRGSSLIDCSGLVQAGLLAAGRVCPHNAAMMRERLGTPVDAVHEYFERGMLVFWNGHVGVMQNSSMLLHATADAGRVVSEPLAHVVERRLQKGQGDIVAVKRL